MRKKEKEILEEKQENLAQASQKEEKKLNEKQKESLWQVIKFTLFSASAGIIQFGSTTLLNEVIKLNYPASFIIGLILSVIWNFTFNRKYTFKSANNIPKAMLLTFCYYLVFGPLSYYFTYEVYKGEVPLIPVPEIAMTAILMIINFVTEFLYQRFVVFRNSINTNNIAKKNKEENKQESVKVEVQAAKENKKEDKK